MSSDNHDHHDHLTQHGHAWIPVQTAIASEYNEIESSMASSRRPSRASSSQPPSKKRKDYDDDDEIVIPGADKMDAKTLARAKNREQAKKSREKKKRAIEGMTAELNDARKRLADQTDFLERAQEKLKMYDEMVTTNRKLAEENGHVVQEAVRVVGLDQAPVLSLVACSVRVFVVVVVVVTFSVVVELRLSNPLNGEVKAASFRATAELTKFCTGTSRPAGRYAARWTGEKDVRHTCRACGNELSDL